MTKKEKRPKYIIKVHQNWRYGPRARFWDIMTWVNCKGNKDGGYWTSVTHGLAYTKIGMRWAINRRFKKMKFGYHDNYFQLDGSVFKGIK
jgi:hypothetical protein